MKVLSFKIPKLQNEALIVREERGSTFYDKFHQHDEIQITYLINGEGELIFPDKSHPYSNGNIFVIGSNIPHLFKSYKQADSYSHMISLFFKKDAIGSHLFEIPELEFIHQFFQKAESGFEPLTKNVSIGKLMLKISRTTKFSKYISFIKLLKKLCECETIVLTKFTYPLQISKFDSERLHLVIDYVINNFHKEITLKEISDLIHMTPNAFCRYFKDRTNKTFFKYLIELRIEHACQLLKNNPDFSIAQISDQSGFNSISHFNRKFKELKKISPSKYLQ